MPENDDSPQSEPQPENVPNRAERRRRGEHPRSTESLGKIQDTGRRNAAQGPRNWSVRRGG